MGIFCLENPYIYNRKMNAPNLEKIVNKYRDIKTTTDEKKLQINVWAEAVFYVTGKSAYALERELTESVNPDQGLIRFFRNIKKGFKPVRNHAQRSIDLVCKIDELYKVPELKQMFYSPFWYLMSSKFRHLASQPGAIRLTMAEIVIICTNNLKSTPSTIEYFEFEEPLRFGRKNPALKKFKVPDCLSGEATFDQVALLGLMYREAYIGCSIGYAMAIREMFLNKLHEVIAKPYIRADRKEKLFNLATERFLLPISQFRRNRADDMEKSFRKTKIKFDNQNQIISFLRSHDKSVQNP